MPQFFKKSVRLVERVVFCLFHMVSLFFVRRDVKEEQKTLEITINESVMATREAT